MSLKKNHDPVTLWGQPLGVRSMLCLSLLLLGPPWNLLTYLILINSLSVDHAHGFLNSNLSVNSEMNVFRIKTISPDVTAEKVWKPIVKSCRLNHCGLSSIARAGLYPHATAAAPIAAK